MQKFRGISVFSFGIFNSGSNKETPINRVLELHFSNISFIVLDSALYNPEYPKFSILDQMPKSNTQVKKNRKILISTFIIINY